MIAEVDAALEALVRRDAVNGARVDVLFDAPNKEWVARRNAPTIDLYLYDIREDLPRRQLAMEPVRNDASGHVTERRLPARRFRLSYLVTAWTQRPEDEHRILSACLATLARNEFIPFDLVEGSLAISPYPVLLTVCLPPPQDRSIADVWSALGGELKPSLDLVATAPLDLAYSHPVGPPILEEPLLGLGGPGIAAETVHRGGRDRVAARRTLGPDLAAEVAELTHGAVLGAPKIPLAGDAPAGGRSGSATATRRGGARPGSAAAAAAAEAEAAAEGTATEVAAAAGAPGAEEPPFSGLGSGRIIRLRGIPRR
jgi:hypothetical protein